MIALMLNLPLPFARTSYGASAPGAGAITTPFEDVLAAMESAPVQEQTAIAFDTCSMFGAAPRTSSPDLSTNDSDVQQTQAPPPITSLSATAQQNVTADQGPLGIAQRASHNPHQDQSTELVTPTCRNLPARALAAWVPALQSPSARSSRVGTGISQPSGAAKARTLTTLKPESLQPIAIAVQETELGLRVIARGSALDPNDLTELRSEAEALLARHGYRVADLDIATAKKE